MDLAIRVSEGATAVEHPAIVKGAGVFTAVLELEYRHSTIGYSQSSS